MRPILAFTALILFLMTCKVNHHYEWPWFTGSGTHIVTNDGNEKMTINYNGEFFINDDETAFESMSPGSHVIYSKGNVDFEAESDSKGIITYYINGDKVTFSSAEKAMLKDILTELSNIGIDAQSKCVKLYNKGGASAILGRIDNLRNDMVKAVYLRYLLEKPNTDSVVTIVLNKIQNMESDFDKSQLLQAVKSINLQSANMVNAYVATLKNIESDFEKSINLKNLLQNANGTLLSTNINEAILSIDSDFEKKGVLEVLLDNKKMVAADLGFVPAIIQTIDSDFEKADILKKYYSAIGSNTPQIIATVNVVKTIESDFEKAAVMKSIASSLPTFSDIEFAEILSVTNGIESNFEKASVIEAYITLAKSDAQWISLINSAEDLEAAFEKENLLTSIAGKMTKSPAVVEAFKHAAQSIDNDASFGKLSRLVNVN